jgi:hypothetical protein
MRLITCTRRTLGALLVMGLVVAAGSAQAQTADQSGSWLNVYGFAMMDSGYNADQINPNWYDTMRVTKLPSFKDEFAPSGNAYFSVRQTRFGVKAGTPTELGDLFAQFEFELFGTGVDEGQTTFRLRHAYAELGQFGAGQYWSPFMDIDSFPNSLEYWGPTGMPFFRNIQIRWMPIKGDTRLTFALERPGASADQGNYAGRIELQGVKPHFPVPDLSAEYRHGGKWGYVEAAGIVRKIEWEDLNNDALNLGGSATGWGINLTSNLNLREGQDILRLGVVYGEGIENYMNDSPADVGIENNPGNAVTPVTGKLLPILGTVVFLDHTWNSKYSTTVGFSTQDIDNTEGQAPNAFHKGEYALANLLYTPVKNFMTGVELQYGKRHNFSDGFTSNGFKVQFSVKGNFSMMFGGKS